MGMTEREEAVGEETSLTIQRVSRGSRAPLHSPEEGVRARQLCCHILLAQDVGQWLCVPPFQVVCP